MGEGGEEGKSKYWGLEWKKLHLKKVNFNKEERTDLYFCLEII